MAVPVFTKEVEIAYLSAFTNSLMVEISRLDAITANKMKSDFISSISRELRPNLGVMVLTSDKMNFEVLFMVYLLRRNS